jgi:hypothetical protein
LVGSIIHLGKLGRNHNTNTIIAYLANPIERHEEREREREREKERERDIEEREREREIEERERERGREKKEIERERERDRKNERRERENRKMIFLSPQKWSDLSAAKAAFGRRRISARENIYTAAEVVRYQKGNMKQVINLCQDERGAGKVSNMRTRCSAIRLSF